MSESLLFLFGLVTVLSLVGMGLTWMSTQQAARRQQAVFDVALRSRESELEALKGERARLEEQVVALWEIDSLQIARRYGDAKQALETRLAGFADELRRIGERRLEAKAHLAELESDDPSRRQEVERLRSEMGRVQQETTRLEHILENLSEVGSIPVQDVKDALARRRARRVEILQRLERLTAEGSARESEVSRLRGEIQRLRTAEVEAEREQEVVRSAGVILDNLLGITPEVRERLAALDARVSSSIGALLAARSTGPIEAVLRASRRSLPAAPQSAAQTEATAPPPEPEHAAPAPAEGLEEAESEAGTAAVARAAG